MSSLTALAALGAGEALLSDGLSAAGAFMMGVEDGRGDASSEDVALDTESEGNFASSSGLRRMMIFLVCLDALDADFDEADDGVVMEDMAPRDELGVGVMGR